ATAAGWPTDTGRLLRSSASTSTWPRSGRRWGWPAGRVLPEMDVGTAALWSLPLGLALDALIGGPRGWPHPVRAIGWLVARVERLLRWAVAVCGSKGGAEFVAGVVLTVAVTGATAAAVAGLVGVAEVLGGWTALAVRA